MKKELGVWGLILLVALGGTWAVSTAQERQAASDRAAIEQERVKEKQPASEGVLRFESEPEMQGPAGTPRPGFPGDFVFVATEMSFGGKLVKGAPYSAQAVTESVQSLSDGNRIINKSTAAVYRDSEGRTRREQTLKSIGPFASSGEPPQTIFISDPVAGTSYTLDPRTQTARKMPPLRFKVSGPKTGDTQASTAPQAVMELNTKEDGKRYSIAIESDTVFEKRVTEAGVATGLLDARNPSARTEALGKQNIEGVEAEGTRTTVTIPAGKIGNELPIDIVSERWYSPELQVIVMTRHTDPRFGENSYKLTNISRAEPSRELFEVPAGYTMTETPTAVRVASSAPITGGVLNGKAINLPKPEYPPIARAAQASGSVSVQITIDEDGNVISANAASGHPLLQAAAVSAARLAKFSPTRLSGQPVKVTGVLVYNFVAQ